MAKTLKELAQRTLAVQDASNLSGVVISWGTFIVELREALTQLWGRTPDTESVNSHAFNVMWADKVSSLTGMQSGDEQSYYASAYDATKKIAEQS